MFDDCEQYKGFNGEHYTQKVASLVVCWLTEAEIAEVDPRYRIWLIQSFCPSDCSFLLPKILPLVTKA